MSFSRLLDHHVVTSALLGLLVASTAACPTVDLGDQPEDPLICRPDRAYFDTVIWPQYLDPPDKARACAAAAGCHRLADGRTPLRLVTDPVDLGRNYDTVRRFLNCSSPLDSPLLVEPLAGTASHGGGDIFPDANDPAVTAFLQWFP